MAVSHQNTLLPLRFQAEIRADRGRHGSGDSPPAAASMGTQQVGELRHLHATPDALREVALELGTLEGVQSAVQIGGESPASRVLRDACLKR